MAVVDASVALKWQFEDEEATEQALALLTDYVAGRIHLIAPSLFPYEVLSGIGIAIRRRRLDEGKGQRALKNILSFEVVLKDSDDVFEEALRLAERHNLSTYDCSYIALADQEDIPFFTGDRKLYNSVRQRLPRVKWIGDYQSPER